MQNLTLILELIGTVAFAISGAVTAIRVKADVFGVLTIAVVTATGGGMIRDVILGETPPLAFVSPIYVATAALTGIIVFMVIRKQGLRLYEDTVEFSRLLFVMDTIGLGIFTATGVSRCMNLYGTDNGFLCVFSGVITGVGGGLLRDMMVDHLPDIFSKYVYAVASIVGALVGWLLSGMMARDLAMTLAIGIILIIRFLAAYYHWNLPKIETEEGNKSL